MPIAITGVYAYTLDVHLLKPVITCPMNIKVFAIIVVIIFFGGLLIDNLQKSSVHESSIIIRNANGIPCPESDPLGLSTDCVPANSPENPAGI